MDPEMKIEQTDNGWVLEFIGGDSLEKRKVCHKWKDVIKELDEYFGWWDLEGKQYKENPYE